VLIGGKQLGFPLHEEPQGFFQQRTAFHWAAQFVGLGEQGVIQGHGVVRMGDPFLHISFVIL
jgi:hypothetical protein